MNEVGEARDRSKEAISRSEWLHLPARELAKEARERGKAQFGWVKVEDSKKLERAARQQMFQSAREAMTPTMVRRKEGFGAEPDANAPRYITACHHESWTMRMWNKSDPGQSMETLLRCRSWRHNGPCRIWRCQQDFARIQEALKDVDKKDVCYLVLTIDPRAWTKDGWTGPYTGPRDEPVDIDPGSKYAAYDHLYKAWRCLYKRLGRQYGHDEWKEDSNGKLRKRRIAAKIPYICTVEAQKNGMPHLNVMLVHSEIAHDVRKLQDEGKYSSWSRRAAALETANDILGDHHVECGFGPRAWLESCNDLEALGGYMNKLAGQQEGFESAKEGESNVGLVDTVDAKKIAEIIKDGQLPVQAPKNFRRIRATQGFLPPPKSEGKWSGECIDGDGRPMRSPKTEEQIREWCIEYYILWQRFLDHDIRRDDPKRRGSLERGLFDLTVLRWNIEDQKDGTRKLKNDAVSYKSFLKNLRNGKLRMIEPFTGKSGVLRFGELDGTGVQTWWDSANDGHSKTRRKARTFVNCHHSVDEDEGVSVSVEVDPVTKEVVVNASVLEDGRYLGVHESMRLTEYESRQFHMCFWEPMRTLTVMRGKLALMMTTRDDGARSLRVRMSIGDGSWARVLIDRDKYLMRQRSAA